MGMVCIYCGNDTQVTNSRHQKRRNHVWRRRKCISCGAIFTTTEQPELEHALSVRIQGRLEPFTQEILLISVYDSLKHRQTATSDAVALTETITSQLHAFVTNAVIERDTLVTIATETLQRFDTAAETFYAAYHPIGH
jgi:transcriptional repressor NrdR